MPAVISWKAFWSATGVVVTGSGAALLALAGVPLAAAVAVLVAVGITALVVVPRAVRGAELLGPLALHDQALALRALQFAIAAHTGVAVAWVAAPQLWLLWTVAVTGVGGLSYAGAATTDALIRRRQAIRDRAQAEAAEAEAEADAARGEIEQAKAETVRLDAAATGGMVVVRESDDPRLVIARALTQGGYHTGFELGGWWPIGGANGVPLMGVRTELHVRPGHHRNMPTLSPDDREKLAVLLKAELRIPILKKDWVLIEPTSNAGVYSLSVTTQNPWGVLYPYHGGSEPLSITDPHRFGFDICGRPHRERINQHTLIVGGTRRGKTLFNHGLREKTARARRSLPGRPGVERWIGGNEKLFDSVGPWIEPYRGTNEPLPFDWVANGARDTSLMLAAAMNLARFRQSVPHSERGDFKTLIVEIDEASFYLSLVKAVAHYQGRECTPSELALNIIKGAGSAGVWLHLITQRSTGNNLGEHGTDILANMQTQIIFGTGDQAEIGRLLGDWKTSVPTNKGEFLLRPSEENRDTTDQADASPSHILRLKSEAIQETDPNRPRLHDGPTLTDLAWNVRHFYDGGLDPRSAAIAGEAYARRHTNADDLWAAFTDVADLNDTPTAATAEPTVTPTADEADETDEGDTYTRTMAVLAAKFGLDTPPTAEPVPPVTSLDTRRSRPHRVIDVIRAAGGTPLTRAQIIDALVARGDQGAGENPQVVTNALTALVRRGALIRVDTGTDGSGYTAAS